MAVTAMPYINEKLAELIAATAAGTEQDGILHAGSPGQLLLQCTTQPGVWSEVSSDNCSSHL
jgi:hypothetical protein